MTHGRAHGSGLAVAGRRCMWLVALAATALWLSGCDKVPTFGELVGTEKKAEEPPPPAAAPKPQPVAVTPPKQEEVKPEPPPEPVKPTPDEALAAFLNAPASSHNDKSVSLLSEYMGEERHRVTVLDIAGSKITDAGAAEIAKFPALTVLNLNGSLITDAGLAYLESLTSLESLSLAGTRIQSQGLRHITGLKNLRELDISETPVDINALPYVAELTNLEKFCFSNTTISGQGFVPQNRAGKLRNLKYIEAKNSAFGNGMGLLKNMNDLEYLDAGQAGVSDESLEMLKNANNLRVLRLGFNLISDRGLVFLKGCRMLEEVSLRQNKQIRGPGLEAFIRCKNLKLIDLGGTGVSKAFVQELQKHVPGVQAKF